MTATPTPPYRPTGWPLAAALLAAAAAMAVGAQLDVPMRPVPMSLQSLAVLGAGALLGPVRGLGAVALYLAAGALGLPVFAGGEAGLDRFAGPTAGYLYAFPLGAVAVGFAARRGWMRRFFPALMAGLAGHAILLTGGALWLAHSIGAEAAVDGGLAPFVIGAVVKSAVLALGFVAVSRGFRPDERSDGGRTPGR